MQEKKCSTCKIVQAIDVFSVDASRKDGLNKQCRACASKRTGAYRQRISPEQKRKYSLKTHHNITPDMYEAMLIAQDLKCAICKLPPSSGRLFIDHDHACCPIKGKGCGKCIRGLLCHHCNTALGLLKEDPTRINEMLNYIKEHRIVLV